MPSPQIIAILYTMHTEPIGVFDSGVGGLSILREIKKLLPNENYIFIADQKNVPYGGKTTGQLRKLSDRIVRKFLDSQVKLIVIACNTATCHAIDYLRRKHPLIPFVGTVPAIKIAAKLSKVKSIAVISTPATSESSYLKKLIKDFASGIKVANIGCPNLEDTVEEGSLNSTKTKLLIKKYISMAMSDNPDYIVLGCTHYPFLKKEIEKISKVKTVDSGKAIARRVKFLLGDKLTKNKKPHTAYFTTGDSKKFSQVASTLLKTKIIAQKIRI